MLSVGFEAWTLLTFDPIAINAWSERVILFLIDPLKFWWIFLWNKVTFFLRYNINDIEFLVSIK